MHDESHEDTSGEMDHKSPLPACKVEKTEGPLISFPQTPQHHQKFRSIWFPREDPFFFFFFFSSYPTCKEATGVHTEITSKTPPFKRVLHLVTRKETKA